MASQFEAFGDMERRAWADPTCATAYVDRFAAITDQAVATLSDAVGAAPGVRVLDLCCGQGTATAHLVTLGCDTVGVDFSATMLEQAKRRMPHGDLRQGDAQALDFPDGSFDAVVSNFGLCHVPDQARALAEVRRVLVPGGQFAMTVWSPPTPDSAFGLIAGAVRSHGENTVSLPPEPGFHRLADREIAERELAAAGFRQIALRQIPCAWTLEDPEDLFTTFRDGTVRMAHLLSQQPAARREAIRRAMTDAIRERFSDGPVWRVPQPASLVTATA
ncbi:MAG: methyltransferase domain-containing protein [Azospirillaceae bacterium]